DNPNPTPVIGLTMGTQIAVGFNNTCVRRSDGSVMCWGAGYNGAMGDGQYQSRSMAVAVPSLSGVTQVAAGNQHACALMGDGSIECWGLDVDGQLGDGISASHHPVAVQMPCPE